MIMILNDALTKLNVITRILLKEGDKELPKELKVKIMRIRMAYSKIKKNFDQEVKEFIKELASPELIQLSQKQEKSDQENIRFKQLNDEFNSQYQEFLRQKKNEEITSPSYDFFTLDEYSDIIEVNVDNNVTVNGILIKAPDFLEIVYDMFIKEN